MELRLIASAMVMYKLRGLDPSMQSFPFSGTVLTTSPVDGTREMIEVQVPRLSVERSQEGNATVVAGEWVSLVELTQVGESEGGSSSSPQLTNELRWLSDSGNQPPQSLKQIIKSVELLMDGWLWAVYLMQSGNRVMRPTLLRQYWLVLQCLRGVTRCPSIPLGKLLRLYIVVLFCTDSWKCIESYTVKRFMIDVGGSLLRVTPDTGALVLGNAPGFAAMRLSDLAGVLGLTVYDLLVEMEGFAAEELLSQVFE